jgi:hypothetical protein
MKPQKLHRVVAGVRIRGRKKGMHLSEETKAQGIQMMRDGVPGPEIRRVLNVGHSTTSRWRKIVDGKRPYDLLRVATPKAKAGKVHTRLDVSREAVSGDVSREAVSGYLAKQLEIVAKMIRAKLPELARFELTVADDGNAAVQYSVRHLTSGTVKL